MTFDDGPDPAWTPRVLAELRDADVLATFFVMARRARAHAHLIDAIAADGHEIGLHCARHLRHTEAGHQVIAADTAEALGSLAALGCTPTRWRVPWGVCADWTEQIAEAHGLSLIGWSADTHDWRGDPATTMLNSIEAAIEGEAVVLMHDGLGPGAKRDGCIGDRPPDRPARPDDPRTRLSAGFARCDGGNTAYRMTRLSPLAPSAPPPSGEAWEPALAEIASHAEALDRAPRFPTAALAALASTGALAGELSFADQLRLVRAVSRADGSVGRILDGHLNAVERLRLLETGNVGRDLDAIADGELWLGLWGADPVGGEGDPATVGGTPGKWQLSGTKVFCSGAGGVHRAAVVARAPDGSSARWLAYVDLTHGVDVDRSWFQGSGMRASESHRVRFDHADIIAVLGEPGELAREPWFSRDAIRTAASWAGMADTAVDGALRSLAQRPRAGELEGLAAGRILTAQKTIDLWLAGAAAADADALPEISVHLRDAVSQAAMTILDEAARACGSRPFALRTPLDRARRDLELLVLQHRLDPIVARRGLKALEAAR